MALIELLGCAFHLISFFPRDCDLRCLPLPIGELQLSWGVSCSSPTTAALCKLEGSVEGTERSSCMQFSQEKYGFCGLEVLAEVRMIVRG